MDEEQPPKIILHVQQTEQHQVGDVTLTYVKSESPVIRLTLDGAMSTELSIDEAMELSIVLELWTEEYAHPGERKKKKGGKRRE